MVGKFSSLARLALLCGLTPAALNYCIHFGYVSAIAQPFLHWTKFNEIYSWGIFKYRILGPWLLRQTEKVVSALGLDNSMPWRIYLIDPAAEGTLWASMFYMNTAFLCLSALILVALLKRYAGRLDEVARDGVTLLCITIMAVAQYVYVPYDMLSMALMLGAMYFALAPPTVRNTAAVAVLLGLATLTRENAALILSFYFARHFPGLWARDRDSIIRLGVLVGVFLSIYVGLRLVLGGEDAVFRTVRVDVNFTDKFSRVGGLLFAFSCLLALTYPKSREQVVLYLLAAAPYWVFMFIISNPREIRIFVPIFVTLVLLQVLPKPDRTAVVPTS